MKLRSFRHHETEPELGRRPHRPTIVLACALSSLGLVIAGTPVVAAVGNPGAGRPHAATFATRHYCASFVSHLAGDMGVSEDRLQSSVTRAAHETIDDAVASGDLTKQQANALKSYLAGRSICSLGIH
jgi:hypothetical protein